MSKRISRSGARARALAVAMERRARWPFALSLSMGCGRESSRNVSAGAALPPCDPNGRNTSDAPASSLWGSSDTSPEVDACALPEVSGGESYSPIPSEHRESSRALPRRSGGLAAGCKSKRRTPRGQLVARPPPGRDLDAETHRAAAVPGIRGCWGAMAQSLVDCEFTRQWALEAWMCPGTRAPVFKRGLQVSRSRADTAELGRIGAEPRTDDSSPQARSITPQRSPSLDGRCSREIPNRPRSTGHRRPPWSSSA